MSKHQDGEAHMNVPRYSGSARINHWIVAISFVLLMISGLALFHPSLYWMTGLFGGGSMARWLHPLLGIVLIVGFFGLFFRFLGANLPERTDWVWLKRMKDVLAGREEYLPEVGKYNAGQKFVFWAQAFFVIVMFITGIGLWPAGLAYFEELLGFKATMDQRRLAAVIHATSAVLTIAVWIIHVYAAIWVRGTMSAMTRGTVTGGWAWRHHRKWLRKEVEKEPRGPQPAE